MSRIFFNDFVPDCTEIPAGLFITTKFSLFSIKILDEFKRSALLGIYFFIFFLFLSFKKIKSNIVTESSFFTL